MQWSRLLARLDASRDKHHHHTPASATDSTNFATSRIPACDRTSRAQHRTRPYSPSSIASLTFRYALVQRRDLQFVAKHSSHFTQRAAQCKMSSLPLPAHQHVWSSALLTPHRTTAPSSFRLHPSFARSLAFHPWCRLVVISNA